MIYAIISDIHANASALRKVMADAWSQGATQVVCLGDVVGYGPEPARSVAMLRIEKAIVIAGNHDDAVSGRTDSANFVDFAADAVNRHRSALRDDEKEWLGALPYIANIEGGAVCVHGDLTAPREFRYIESTADAAANFAICANQVIFVGHTHEPCLFITGKSGKIYKTDPQDFTMEPGKRYIVNVGTVGYPREENGTCLSSYVLYDSKHREIRYRFLPFSVSSVMQRGAPAEPVSSSQPTSATPATPIPPAPPANSVTSSVCVAMRERRAVIIAVCAIAAISVFTLAFVLGSRQSVPVAHKEHVENANVIKSVESAESVKSVESSESAKVNLPDPSQPLMREISLNGGEKEVFPNIRLTRNSSEAVLTGNFLDQSGAVIKTFGGTKKYTFKQSKNLGIAIPLNACRVQFVVTPVTKGTSVFISRFAPYAQ